MPAPDTTTCAWQVNIPPVLPGVLKNYAKETIRAQPKDLLHWSIKYFTAFSRGESLPIKDRAGTCHTPKKNIGLTLDLLKTLHRQMSSEQTCNMEVLQKKWEDLCLPMVQLNHLLLQGNFSSDIKWLEFLLLGCSALGGTLMCSLKYACEILTEVEDGGAASIPFNTFTKLYTYLAHLDGDVPQSHIDNFLSSLQPLVELQQGMISPLDFIPG
ncbi:ropporin-1-like protein [Aulostomus maculatus]